MAKDVGKERPLATVVSVKPLGKVAAALCEGRLNAIKNIITESNRMPAARSGRSVNSILLKGTL